MNTTRLLLWMGAGLLGATLVACGNPSAEARDLKSEGSLTLTLKPGQTRLVAGQPQRVVVKIALTGPQGEPGERLPLNIAVVLDRSGSMSGAKIEQAKQAALQLVDRLQPRDTFALVVYDTNVDVLIPAQPVEDAAALKRRIASIRSGGSTALYAGVEEGSVQLKRYLDDSRLNRVLLLSDGLANVGPSSNGAIASLGRQLARRGISVTTIGLGADYNEDLLAALAEASDANYYYVQDTETLPGIFAEELGGLMAATARNVRVEVVVPRGIRPLGFIGRDESFQDMTARVNFGPLAAGQQRYLLLECEMPATSAGTRRELAYVGISYDDTATGQRRNVYQHLFVEFVEDEKDALASADADVQVDVALQRNAVAKDKAIALADAGRNQASSDQFADQAGQLRALAANAPAERQAELREEAAALEQTAQEVKDNGLSKTSRKARQWESYRTRNAK